VMPLVSGLTAAVPDFTTRAEAMLRQTSHFDWAVLCFVGLAFYVYSVEAERRRWDIVLAGLGFWCMDWFNELANSAVLHISHRAALWTVTGTTTYLILIGLTAEISLLFLITGVVFVKMLPRDRTARVAGMPNRLVYVVGFSCLSVGIEIVLHAVGVLHWAYWWWNVPFVPLIVVFGYMTFYGLAAWIFDMGADHRRQLAVVGAVAGVDAALALSLGLAGWL